MSKQIPLTQGKIAIVDDEDFKILNQYKWHAQKHGRYFIAARRIWDKQKKRYFMICMHREIMNLQYKDGKQVDHINHNGLDNHKRNLRICTGAENCRNRVKIKGSSIYKGVSWFTRDKKWMACIRLNYKTYYLGYFNSEISAAKAYDNAAKRLFGEFAAPNFGDEKYG